MTQSEGSGTPTESITDPRAVANVIKPKPPVALLREDIRVVDQFGSLDVANRLGDVVEKVEPPFTISVSGAWGVGKTTLAKQLKARLEDHVPFHERVRCVEIDLWAEDIADLRRLVALKVAVELEDHQSPQDRDKALKRKAIEFDDQLRRARTVQERPRPTVPLWKSHPVWALLLFVAILLGILLLWGFTTPNNPNIDSTGPKAVVTVLTAVLIWTLIQSGLVFSVVTSSSSMQPVAEKIGLQLKFKEEVTKYQDRKVLVILDNLDRLTGDTAVEALAEIRSFVEFDKSRCLFLVPLDRDALERHLRRTMGGDDRSARDYLDKFFNLDILLTKPVMSDLRVWTRDLLTVLFPDVDPGVLSPVAEYAAAAADGSPRATKRILNGVYTRAYLLPRPSAIRMDELVLVEALIARFPMCVNRLNAEPPKWLAFAASVRSTTDADLRRPNLRWLLGKPQADPKDGVVEVEDEEFSPFVNFLMLTRNVDLRPESIRAILALRPDRQWGLRHRGDEAAVALLGGDSATLAAILDDTPAADRAQTIHVAIDQLETDRKQNLPIAVVNGINALSSIISPSDDLAANLRDVAADFLATTTQSDFRLLSSEAIEFVFAGGLVRLSQGKAILNRAVAELMPGGSPDATAVVRILATVADDIDGTIGATARALLAKLSDLELEPLFDDIHRNRGLLAGEVESLYIARLSTWDPNDADQAQFERAAQRLQTIRVGHWNADDAGATAIAAQATLQVATLPDAADAAVLAIAAMLADVGANASVDAFALALAQTPRLALFKVALGLASDPAAFKAVATRRLSAAGLEEFRDLVGTERSPLEAAGVDVATIAAGRWAAGQGFEYARLTLTPGRDADADSLAAGLAAIADQDAYVAIVTAVVPVLVELAAVRAASAVVADIALRFPLFKDATLAQLAPVVRGLKGLTSTNPVLSALEAAIAAAPAASMGETTLLVRTFADAKVEGAQALPPALAVHAAALGAIDLDQARWLVGQKGVKPGDVRTAMVAMIKTEPLAVLAPALEAIRGHLKGAWQIGKALVERAAVSPDGSRDEWLVQAEHWHAPPSRGQRQSLDDYAAALDTAAQDPDAQTTIARLRGKL